MRSSVSEVGKHSSSLLLLRAYQEPPLAVAFTSTLALALALALPSGLDPHPDPHPHLNPKLTLAQP